MVIVQWTQFVPVSPISHIVCLCQCLFVYLFILFEFIVYCVVVCGCGRGAHIEGTVTIPGAQPEDYARNLRHGP